MTNLTDLSLVDLKDGFKKKEFSAVDVAGAYIKAMEKTKSLNAYITETPELALEQAKASDARLAKGEAGALEGVPIAVKDLFCTKGVLTTASSKILHNFVPPYESTVTQKMFDAGMVMLGKVNHDQFGMGSTTTHSHYGQTINPWKMNGDDADIVPGGSSGGSSAAVAAQSCVAALATDTGGSSRQPAAFTGTVGLKPTYGRCSRWGVIAYASSLDCPSLIARTVSDSAVLLETMAGYDAKDSTSANIDVPNFLAGLGKEIKGLKVGIAKEHQVDGLDGEVKSVWEQTTKWLQDAGAEIVDIDLPNTKYALPAYYIIAPAEASSNLARYDGVRYGLRVDGDDLTQQYENTRGEGFGPEVLRRILIGTFTLSAGYYDAYYGKAQKVRALVARDFARAFEKVDVILSPTAPTPPFKVGENSADPVQMYLQDVYTITANLAGIPAMSVPVGLSSKGLPIGMQLMGKAFDEQTLFQVGRLIEQAANFTAKPTVRG